MLGGREEEGKEGRSKKGGKRGVGRIEGGGRREGREKGWKEGGRKVGEHNVIV